MIGLIFAVALAGQPQISGILRDPVRIFDKDGVAQGTLPQSAFKLPVLIEGANARGQPKVEVGGKVIYVKSSDVETQNVGGECIAANTPGQASGSSLAASNVGAGAGLSTKSARCLPPPGK
jgi:hypothetical protein